MPPWEELEKLWNYPLPGQSSTYKTRQNSTKQPLVKKNSRYSFCIKNTFDKHVLPLYVASPEKTFSWPTVYIIMLIRVRNTVSLKRKEICPGGDLSVVLAVTLYTCKLA